MKQRPAWLTKFNKATVPLVVKVERHDGSVDWWGTSGFVVEAGSRWFWISADHPFHGKRYQFESGIDTLCEKFPRLEPTFHFAGDESREGILSSLDLESFVGMPTLGQWLKKLPGMESQRADFISSLDLAFFELTPYYRENFSACGIEPLTSKDVYREYDKAFLESMSHAAKEGRLAFFISGAPSSCFKKTKGEMLESLAVKTLAITPNEQSENELEFKAIWSERAHEGSVAGMSGGPAYAVVGDEAFWFGVQAGEKRYGGTPHRVVITPASFAYRVIEATAQFLDSPAGQAVTSQDVKT